MPGLTHRILALISYTTQLQCTRLQNHLSTLWQYYYLFSLILFTYAVARYAWSIYPTQQHATGLALRIIFLAKAMSLALQAIQIRYGLPHKSTLYGYRLYRALPFLYELRWFCTATSLTMYDWLKLEDVNASLYLVKRDTVLNRATHKHGERQSKMTKCCNGICLFFILLCMLGIRKLCCELLGLKGCCGEYVQGIEGKSSSSSLLSMTFYALHNFIIPVAFFLKYVEGKYERNRVKLSSDASDKNWAVKLDGRKLTGGWKDFATAHSLRIGDIAIFKHEGDMVCHVTPLGPSCCEIQYTQPHTIKEEDNEIRHVLRKKNTNPEAETGTSSLSHHYCFVAQVQNLDLKLDKLQLPFEAARSIALNRRRYRKIILANQEGISWTLSLKSGGGCYYIKGGWNSFCLENRHKVGDLVTFNLVGDGTTTPLLCICPEEECVELINEYKSKEREEKKKKKKSLWTASSSAKENRFVTINLTRYNFQNSKLILPIDFVMFHKIDKHEKIVLMDKDGVKRLVRLIQDGRIGRKGLGQGWKFFCEANDVSKPDVSFVLELLWEDSVPVLKFRNKVKPVCV